MIGLIPISAKPYHLGHHKLIEIANTECSSVIVFVSLEDRIRKNEFPIYGDSMQKIWQDHLLKIQSKNTEIYFCDKTETPIKCVFSMLDKLKDKGIKACVYGGEDIKETFSDFVLNKYFAGMIRDICVKSFKRTDLIDISGTKMRSFLSYNQKYEFFMYLPDSLDKEEIWNILRNRI